MTPREAVLKAAELCDAHAGNNLCTPIGFARGDQARECASAIRDFADTLKDDAAERREAAQALRIARIYLNTEYLRDLARTAAALLDPEGK